MTDLKLPWPDVRRSIFHMEGSRSDSATKCFIKHIGLLDFGNSYLSGQYKRAADLLIKAKQKDDDTFQPDGLFMPVVFLYRHALELKLKGLLEIIIDCELLDENEKISKLLNRHNIIKLWDEIKIVLLEEWPNADRKPLNNVEALLQDFHKIDKSGQSLRYSKVKKGGDVRDKFPRVVRLELLLEAFEEMYSFLDACLMHFDNMFEKM